MSGFGIGLLMFCLIVGLVALIKFFSWVEQAREQGLWPSLMSRSGPQYVSQKVQHSEPDRRDLWANERTNEPEPEPNAALESGTDERTGAFVLNPDECAAIHKMIEHKVTAENPTKASIIWAGFGLKKGDSAKYKRASAIYDALFVAPVIHTPIANRPTTAKFRQAPPMAS